MNINKTVLAYFFLCFNSSAVAEGLTFGLVAKSINDVNFIDVWQGCHKAAKSFGDRCLLLGGKGNAQIRRQEEAIQSAVKSQQYDALAISVMNSEFAARALQNINIPVITFDSPFNEKYQFLSHAYVGIDNIEFGKDLAKIAKTLLPKGGTICFMTVMHDRNLALRIQGARAEFSDNNKFTESQRLGKKGKWTELNRCPWYTSDNIERSHDQLEYTIRVLKPDVFIAVGHWPVSDITAYKKLMEPFRQQISHNKPLLIFGIGSCRKNQLSKLINAGLVHGFASINFPQLGKNSYEIMKKLVQDKTNKNISRKNYIPSIIEMKK